MDSDKIMYDKLRFSSKKKNTVFSLALIVALLTMVFLPIQESAAAPITDTPTGVDGRVLPASLAGDTSDWVEIAQNGDYSLILRANYLNIYSVKASGNKVYYNDPLYQATLYGPNTNYMTSTVRDKINAWFNGNAPGDADKLPADARLRDFTMQVATPIPMGTTCNPAVSLTNGYSKPTTYQTRVGTDVAFALSYGEAANFCSQLYFMRQLYIANQPSSALAVSNYNKIYIPPGYIFSMWLRSPGDIAGTAGSLTNSDGIVGGRVFQSFNDNKGSEKSLVYPAVWVKSTIFETTPPSYGISYVLNGGVHSGIPDSYVVSALPVAIANPTRTGYNFQHWMMTCANGSVVQLSASGIPVGTKGDVVLTAIWGTIQYTITYNLNGGTPAAGNPTTYNIENAPTINANTVVAPTMTGYRFVNWRAVYTNGTSFELTASGIPTGSTGNVILAAIWDPTPISFSITYVLDGGTNAPGNPSTYTVANVFPVHITNPSKSGHTFLGWIVVYNNGTIIPLTTSYSIPAGSAGDVTLTAVWSPPIQSYSIAYNLNGGVNAAGNPTAYNTGNLPLSIANPTRAGFVFSQWIMICANGSFVSLSTGVIPAGTTGDVTLMANWNAAPVYNINYALNGGVNAAGNPTSYTTSSSSINIAAPSMPGFTFLYWIAVYADGSLGVLPASGIAAGTTGDVTLIAVWYP